MEFSSRDSWNLVLNDEITYKLSGGKERREEKKKKKKIKEEEKKKEEEEGKKKVYNDIKIRKSR